MLGREVGKAGAAGVGCLTGRTGMGPRVAVGSVGSERVVVVEGGRLAEDVEERRNHREAGGDSLVGGAEVVGRGRRRPGRSLGMVVGLACLCFPVGDRRGVAAWWIVCSVRLVVGVFFDGKVDRVVVSEFSMGRVEEGDGARKGLCSGFWDRNR